MYIFCPLLSLPTRPARVLSNFSLNLDVIFLRATNQTTMCKCPQQTVCIPKINLSYSAKKLKLVTPKSSSRGLTTVARSGEPLTGYCRCNRNQLVPPKTPDLLPTHLQMTTKQMPLKLFIQMSGAPGSGKSTLARLIGKSIGGVVIDHDILRASLLDSGVPFYDAAKQSYELQWMISQDMMKQGYSVIMDSPCNFQEVLDQGSAYADKYGHDYWYIECCVQDTDLLDQRLRAREPLSSQRTGIDRPPAGVAGKSRSDGDANSLWEKWIKHPYRPEHNAIILDSTDSSEALCAHVMKQIGGQ